MHDFLPISRGDMERRGWDYYDFLCVTGDAYTDHPSFGHAIISRILEAAGYRVCILAQPDWTSKAPFLAFGRPRLGALITAGNLDSMVAHYTAAKKMRSDDAYSPGGKAGKRPDRATIVYANRLREAFENLPIIIGGVEASLRRFAHYDYWQDKVRRSILLDAGADLLVYGMGEAAITQIANELNEGKPIKEITHIRGTCYITTGDNVPKGAALASFKEVSEDKRYYAIAAAKQYQEHNPYHGQVLLQAHGRQVLVQNPPQPPATREYLDFIYALPYARAYHPIYESAGGIGALEEVKFSITATRGCLGSCNFCALGLHQGKVIQTRSEKSILTEAQNMVWEPGFKGYIHDVGGPSANFYDAKCKKGHSCSTRNCLFPDICPNLEVSHKKYLQVLRKLRELDGVKRVFIRSGIRYDYLLADKDDAFFKELCQYHISGQLKVAPEHISHAVLACMGKPPISIYNRFADRFYKINGEMKKEQYLVPYLMSSHPGSTLRDAIDLALYLKLRDITPQQVQDFYPTPGTIATAMYHTGLDPYTLRSVYVPKSAKEKAMQRALLQVKNPMNQKLVYEALMLAGRKDLIGHDPDCLIRPLKQDSGYGHKNTVRKADGNGKDTRRKNGVTKNKGRAQKSGGKAGEKGNYTGSGSGHRGR